MADFYEEPFISYTYSEGESGDEGTSSNVAPEYEENSDIANWPLESSWVADPQYREGWITFIGTHTGSVELSWSRGSYTTREIVFEAPISTGVGSIPTNSNLYISVVVCKGKSGNITRSPYLDQWLQFGGQQIGLELMTGMSSLREHVPCSVLGENLVNNPNGKLRFKMQIKPFKNIWSSIPYTTSSLIWSSPGNLVLEFTFYWSYLKADFDEKTYIRKTPDLKLITDASQTILDGTDYVYLQNNFVNPILILDGNSRSILYGASNPYSTYEAYMVGESSEYDPNGNFYTQEYDNEEDAIAAVQAEGWTDRIQIQRCVFDGNTWSDWEDWAFWFRSSGVSSYSIFRTNSVGLLSSYYYVYQQGQETSDYYNASGQSYEEGYIAYYRLDTYGYMRKYTLWDLPPYGYMYRYRARRLSDIEGVDNITVRLVDKTGVVTTYTATVGTYDSAWSPTVTIDNSKSIDPPNDIRVRKTYISDIPVLEVSWQQPELLNLTGDVSYYLCSNEPIFRDGTAIYVQESTTMGSSTVLDHYEIGYTFTIGTDTGRVGAKIPLNTTSAYLNSSTATLWIYTSHTGIRSVDSPVLSLNLKPTIKYLPADYYCEPVQGANTVSETPHWEDCEVYYSPTGSGWVQTDLSYYDNGSWHQPMTRTNVRVNGS